jgi:murein DD-endopeptidase MepM/ murein hydrolase activator NlpD
MLYATDVVKLDARGPQFMPPQNEDYPIFGENIYSPLDGEVVRVVNDIDDNIPFSGNYPYNTGNTVVIRHENYYFLLGHLKKGSIVVSEGHWVAKDTLIAQAGNSGMSERPHLHMQLMKSDNGDYWKGNGISICYQGKNLYKNRLVKI